MDLRHRLRGIVTAAVVPFREGGGLDEDGYAQNVDRIMSTGRVAGILANGHTGEILSLSRSERKRTVAICREVVGDRGIVMGGVHGQSTWETLESMQDAAEAGADCCEVFSPFVFSRGAFGYPDTVFEFYATLDREAGIPFLFMQYPPHSNLCMPADLMREVAGLANVVGVKQAVGDISRFASERKMLKSMSNSIAYLTAGEGALFSAFSLGCDGALIGFSNFVDPIADLWDAVQNGSIEAARSANDRLYPLSTAIYGLPSFRWSTRLKYAMWRAGYIHTPVVRGPLSGVTSGEAATIDAALESLGLLRTPRPATVP